MAWNVSKIGISYQKLGHAIGRSAPPIGCVLYLPGLPGGGNWIYDRSPYGNIGTIVGATWVRLPSGLWCLSFDGTDDYVNCGANESLEITGPITIETWLKLTTPGTTITGTIYQRSPTANQSHLFCFSLTGQGGLSYYNSNMAAWAHSSVAVNDGYWHHAVVTGEGSNGAFYIDSQQKGAFTFAGAPSYSGDAIIGKYPGNVRYFAGSIVLLRVHNRALSALQVQNHYQREKHLFGVC